jgi:putative membrane protein
MYWNHDHGTGMWIGMVGGSLLGLILLAGLGYLLVRLLLDARSAPAGTADPVVLLDQRLARGEIDIEDYRRRRALLAQRPGSQPPEPDPPGHG